MTLLAIIYVLIFIIFALVAYAVMQIKLAGIEVKDFWSFIEANQILDKLYAFAKHYQSMSTELQIIYLSANNINIKIYFSISALRFKNNYYICKLR